MTPYLPSIRPTGYLILLVWVLLMSVVVYHMYDASRADRETLARYLNGEPVPLAKITTPVRSASVPSSVISEETKANLIFGLADLKDSLEQYTVRLASGAETPPPAAPTTGN